MSEKQIEVEIEINCVGWWCLFEDGLPVAIVRDKDFAETMIEPDRDHIKQITKKIPFENK